MKIWVDDVRTPPTAGYSCAKSVFDAIEMIVTAEKADIDIELIDLDHDAGEYVNCGGGLYPYPRLAGAYEEKLPD